MEWLLVGGGVLLILVLRTYWSTKSNAIRIYDRAMSAKGDRKIGYAEKYLALLRKANASELHEVYNRGIDLFSKDISLGHIDIETKKALYPIALDYVKVAKEKGISNDGWDKEYMRDRLIVRA